MTNIRKRQPRCEGGGLRGWISGLGPCLLRFLVVGTLPAALSVGVDSDHIVESSYVNNIELHAGHTKL